MCIRTSISYADSGYKYNHTCLFVTWMLGCIWGHLIRQHSILALYNYITKGHPIWHCLSTITMFQIKSQKESLEDYKIIYEVEQLSHTFCHHHRT